MTAERGPTPFKAPVTTDMETPRGLMAAAVITILLSVRFSLWPNMALKESNDCIHSFTLNYIQQSENRASRMFYAPLQL